MILAEKETQSSEQTTSQKSDAGSIAPADESGNTAEQWEDVEMPHVKIAAIDNGLAFPFKHPDEWRTCKFFEELRHYFY